jgi:hypothetical protein
MPLKAETKPGTVSLHVKLVPRLLWLQARQRALEANVSFRDYMIDLLTRDAAASHSRASALVPTHTGTVNPTAEDPNPPGG